MLQLKEKTGVQYEQFGWKNNNTAFLYGSNLYTAEGVVPVAVSKELHTRSVSNTWIGRVPGGSLERWSAAVEKLFRSNCEPHSIVVLAGFAAPLMRFLDSVEGGAVLHTVSAESGTGKSLAAIAAITVWGTKRGLGLTQRDTEVTKALTLGALGNLPAMHDELVEKDPELVRQFITMITEGRDRMRGTSAGEINHTLASWQTLLLSSANESLVDALFGAGKRHAMAYRIMEFDVKKTKMDHINGELLKHELEANAGYAGHAYMQVLVRPATLAKTRAHLEQYTAYLWKKTGYDSNARFWIRSMAAIGTAGMLASELKLIPFKVNRLMEWLLDYMPKAYDLAEENAQWAPGLIGEFLAQYGASNIICFLGPYTGGTSRPQRIPHGAMVGRWEEIPKRLYISQMALRQWMQNRNLPVSYSSLVLQLKSLGAVISEKQKILNAGFSEMPSGQVRTLELDMRHEALAGMVPDVLHETNVVPLTRSE